MVAEYNTLSLSHSILCSKLVVQRVQHPGLVLSPRIVHKQDSIATSLDSWPTTLKSKKRQSMQWEGIIIIRKYFHGRSIPLSSRKRKKKIHINVFTFNNFKFIENWRLILQSANVSWNTHSYFSKHMKNLNSRRIHTDTSPLFHHHTHLLSPLTSHSSTSTLVVMLLTLRLGISNSTMRQPLVGR